MIYLPENVPLLKSQILKYKSIDPKLEKQIPKYDNKSLLSKERVNEHRQKRKKVKSIIKHKLNTCDIDDLDSLDNLRT